MKNLRIAFAGTPRFAVVALQAIVEAGWPVGLVLTQPDRPAGRGMKCIPSEVKRFALDHRLTLDQPTALKSDRERAALAAFAPDVLIVAAYGLLLPRAVLDLPRRGCINIHASLLPRWRGAAPIHRAIEAGDAESGITIMQMDEGLDTGPMLLQKAIRIAPDETTGSLHDRLAQLGGECIVEALTRLDDLQPEKQPEEGATYARKICRAEATLDWRQPAVTLERKIRAFDPFPGAAGKLGETTVKIWAARLAEGRGEPGAILSADRTGIVVACGDGALQLLALQRPGGKRLGADAFLRGFPAGGAGLSFSG